MYGLPKREYDKVRPIFALGWLFLGESKNNAGFSTVD